MSRDQALARSPRGAHETCRPAELIERAIRGADRSLATGLWLRELALSDEFYLARTTWRGVPVALETRAYTGPRVRYARVAILTGGDVAIGNLLVLGEAQYALPVLGADVVWLGARNGAMVATDLSPTIPPGLERDVQLAPLARRSTRYRALPSGGELPHWCAHWFSSFALYVRVGPGDLPAALDGVQEYVAAFIDLAKAAPADERRADATLAAHRDYATSHREDDRGLGLLSKLFGDEWAGRYIADVLFPAEPPRRCV